MKHSVSIVVLMFLAIYLSAETTVWEWVDGLGGAGTDEAKGITCATNGDVLVVGAFSDSFVFNGETLFSNGTSDILICRYNNYGQELWARSYGSTGIDLAYAVALDSQENILVTGTFSGSISFGAISLVAGGARDVFVLKLSPLGDVVWAVQAGGSSTDINSDTGRGICVDENDHVYVTGFFRDTFNWNSMQLICNGITDCFVARLSPDGNPLWLNKAASSGADMAYSIKVNSGQFFVCGSFSTSTIAIPPAASLTGSETISGFYAYGNTETGIWTGGKTIYDTHATQTGIIEIQDLELDSQANILVTGTYNQSNTLGLSVSSTDIFVAKFNPDNTQSWAYRIGGSGAEPSNASIAVDASDNVIAAGGFTGTCSFNSQASIATFGGNDAFVVKISPAGQTLWTQRLGGDANDQCFGVAVDPWGYPIIAGNILSAQAYYDTQSISSHNGGDIFVGKLDNLQVDFTATTLSGYAPLIVPFVSNSSGHGPLVFQWDFDNDGVIDSNLENPTWVYGVQGFYSVTLTVSDGYTSEALTRTSYICAIQQPEAVFEFGLSFGTILNEYCNGIARDTDGNIYVTGYFSESIQFGDVATLTTSGGTDCYVAKLSASGQWLWGIKNYGGLYNDRNQDIVVDNNGNIYIGGIRQDSAGFYKTFVQKLDPLGTELWIAVSQQGSTPHNPDISYQQNTYINKIVLGTNGYVYAVGYHNYYAKFGSVTTGLNRTTSYSSWVCGISQSTGAWLWAKGIASDNLFVNTSYMINMTDVVLDQSNNLYICVYFNDKTNYYSPVGFLQSNGGYDIIVMKYNPTGSFQWYHRIGTANSEVATGIGVDDTGNVILSGYFSSSITFGTITLTGGSQQLFVTKMLPNFTFEWAITTSTTNYVGVGELLKVSSDEFMICGSANGNTYFGDYFLNCDGTDIIVAKFDLAGNWIWAIHGGGSATDYANDMVLTPNGAPIICGNIQGPATLGSIVLPHQGGYDGFVAKLETLKADFSADATSGYAPFTVQFTDTSLGFVNYWEWDFDDDGVVDSYEQNPSWTFTEVGNYTVKLLVSDGFASTSATKYHYIHCYLINSEFTSTSTIGFVPLQVSFSDQTEGPVINWQWDFDGDGSIDSDNEDQIWTYLFPGVFSVSLTISDGTNSDTETRHDLVHVSLNPDLVIYVPQDYPTIQAAIAHADDGDYIIVADGVYHENLNLLGKDVTIASYFIIDGDSTHITNTIIDGGNPQIPDEASTITIIPHNNSRPFSMPHIVGFTIKSGSGRRIIQNEGGSTIEKRVGGGIYIRQSNPMFSYNRIEDNDADDEGGGSYAFQSLPNFGGMVNTAVGIRNPGANYFRNNHADIGSDIYIHGVTTRDDIKIQDCSFEVFSTIDTTLSNYWASSSAPLSFEGCSGVAEAITTDIYVASNGSDTQNTGITPSSPFKTIDHALSRIYATADNPLTIYIAAGTYSPSLTGEKFPLQMVKHVSLTGSGVDETFLDAEGSADFPRRVLNLDKVEGVKVSGLTLMNGFVTLAKNYNGGAVGILNSQASLSNLIVAGSSSAGNGAGIYAFNSTVALDSLDIQYNSALGSGGGIHSVQSALNLSESQITNNSVSKNGAGISIDGGQISIVNCQISQNQATGYQSKGGALSLSGTQNAYISGNRMLNNNADNGGGAYLQDNVSLRLDRNRFSNNLADYAGGAMFVNTSSGQLTNNLISNNSAIQRGGGLYCYSPLSLLHNTIVKNKAGLQGGGMYLNSASPSLNGNILWGNVHANPEVSNQLYLYGEASDPDILWSDIQGGIAGFVIGSGSVYTGTYESNLDADPLFSGPSTGAGYQHNTSDDAYNLTDASPCIDAGEQLLDTSLFPIDLSGNPRLDNGRIDIGAWEKPHFNGALIVADPVFIDFGRVNINGLAPTAQLTLSNSGNQDLLITEIGFQTSTTVFSYDIEQRNQLFSPGASLTLNLTFSPGVVGLLTNQLLVHSNSLNYPILSIPLSGTGIDASTSYPSDVQLQVIGDDVHLNWNPVLSDPLGNPYNPGGYIVLYSENADTVTDNYFFLSWTEEPNHIHSHVARYRNKMFYKIIAIDETLRLNLVRPLQRSSGPVRWIDLKREIRMPGNSP